MGSDPAHASEWRQRYGPWALVAGGSAGIGEQFGIQLAQAGLNLVLVAEKAEPLRTVAERIESQASVRVRTVVADLSERSGLAEVRAQTAELEVGLLVFCAVKVHVGRWLEQDEASQLQQIDLNCRAPLSLAMTYGRDMARRGRGGIVLLSSMTAQQGIAGVAVYAATKAFNLILGEGLWAELRPRGVDVLAVCPGITRTPGLWQTNPRVGRGVPVQDAAAVVREALEALGGRPSLIPGRANRAVTWVLQRVLSRRQRVGLMTSSVRRMYPTQLS